MPGAGGVRAAGGEGADLSADFSPRGDGAPSGLADVPSKPMGDGSPRASFRDATRDDFCPDAQGE